MSTTTDTSVTATPSTESASATDAAEALAGRLFDAGLAAVELATVCLGGRLGLYQVLADSDPRTPTDLATEAGIDVRYAQEWLEQQSAAGILTVDDPAAGPDERRYRLPADYGAVLLDPDSLAYTLPLAELPQVIAQAMPALEQAYRHGGGVPYAAYGIHDTQAAFNRPAFVNLLTTQWLPAIPYVEQRLRSGARVVELGCGEGWAAVTLAAAYSAITVDGFDSDDASIAAARRHAATAGVSDRVHFDVADITGDDLKDGYDIAFCFEVLHDLARPIEALRTARRITSRPDAVTIVMDERVGERFTAPADPIERFLYAASVLHCLPVGMSEQPSAATGTVIRPSTLRRYATEAGFTQIEELAIEHPMFRFYRLNA